MISWTTEKRSLADLKPAPYNPRKFSDKERQDLTSSIERFSIADPIIINKNNNVIGGHFRINILKERGVAEVDVRVPDRELTQAEEKELNLRLNKNLGQWDWDALSMFDEEMLKGAGFTDEELMENFGLSDAEAIEVDPERFDVITVEAPEAPRLYVRQSFYCENKDDFNKLKEFFKTDKDGRLDLTKLMDLIR